ncbi:exopolygalacturonase-like [Rhodamnia argentea]|uniref:Exopolygalacturonase-like n=1 Tax=Rhodamnia argentea TaxID=178133 RepID=A0ABM3HA21_9MYRT|nr:exopolygalacturonase-like [Rhodamnia argentea]
MVWPEMFMGPCTGSIIFTVKGAIKLPVDKSTFSLNCWITFQYISGMLINGGGTFDGQGHLVNSKNFHFVLFSCNALEFSGVRITARGNSPKTDGIHIGYSSCIKIADSMISTQDDCISIGLGSKDVEIAGVHCRLGHGFSLGSLRKYPNEADVTGLSVRGCPMVGTQNGGGIKTWASGVKRNAYNLSIDDITMKDVQSPIIIDQEYCPGGGCSK